MATGTGTSRGTSLTAAVLSGVFFGFGLSYATMVKPEVVLSFLQLRDFGLLLVLGGPTSVTMITYQLAPRLLAKPLLSTIQNTFDRHAGTLDRQTVIGAAMFGVGWGICGVCPGPAIAGLGVGNWPALYALAGILAGAYLHGRFFGR